MPRLSVWSIRAALLYLLVGFTLGGLLLANKGMPFWPAVWGLLPYHIEFLLVGWMVQLAVGVAFWILPRFQGGSRGNEAPAWAAFALLNAGILMAAAQPVLGTQWLGRGCEAAAAGLFLFYAWKRVKPLGN